jgi:peptidoglycan/LPS O-acetylase OafA/YrhL
MARGASANLDFLRSVAVLLVLVDHLMRHFHIDHWGRVDVNNFGLFGVLLFFVHTSLVLMQSLERSGLGGRELVRNFYIRRFFRIYPLSILTVLVAFGLGLHATGRGLALAVRPGAKELFSNLLLIQNLTGAPSIVGPLWSLPLEVQMYLVLPFPFLWRRRSVMGLLVMWVACGVLGHFPQTVPALAWFSLLIYVPNFLPGVIAYTLPERRTLPAWAWPAFLALLAASYLLLPSRRVGALLCLLLGAAIPRFKELAWRPLKVLSNRIATYSYGIYLGHSFCIWYALTRHDSWLLFWAMWLVIPVVVYHALERPAIRLGGQLAERMGKPRVIPAVAEVAEENV